ncbi:hypothetical protein EVAR_40804_1 [Eumeta japonica]|uniref:Uncharacterized protein n=1 Tax=Eumeta variegata TaxID=151549 RepID=A0A4C1X6G3_EUMVA|nr:hypothetical protein EVAR_40804_1 [Eumeta japonica]
MHTARNDLRGASLYSHRSEYTLPTPDSAKRFLQKSFWRTLVSMLKPNAFPMEANTTKTLVVLISYPSDVAAQAPSERRSRCYPHRRPNSILKSSLCCLSLKSDRSVARLTVDEKKVQRRWFPRTVEVFDEQRHRLETWRTGAAYRCSTDRGREKDAAALISAHGESLRRTTAQT